MESKWFIHDDNDGVEERSDDRLKIRQFISP